MLHSQTLRNTSSTAVHPFDRGDYLAAARDLPQDDWRHWASLAAMGRSQGVADELIRVADPGAQLYAGIAAWIDGDDERAAALLRRATGEHARRLLALIERRPITVVAQLPWNRSGPWDIVGELRDPAFRLFNISFHPEDIQNRPYASAAALVPPGLTPDFYLAEMFEWHLIPPAIRELGCPVIGHTSDYDIHIQTVAPWFDVFDELLVLDSAQWRDVAALAPAARVSVFPKVFGVPRRVPPIQDGERPIDVFLSGTVVHPYHPDKDAVVLQLLEPSDIRLRMVNGFDAPQNYYRSLAEAKLCVNYVRHPGGLPTRGLEALAMGCVIAVQDENVLPLLLDGSAGVVTYGPRSGPLSNTVRSVLRDWETFARAAQHGSALVRAAFDLRRVATQYLRFATVAAARPRQARRGPDPSLLVQKRAIVQKGWLPSYQFGGTMLNDWADASVSRLQQIAARNLTASALNDIARERLLASFHHPVRGKGVGHLPAQPGGAWLPSVIDPLEQAVQAFPCALVPRLNLTRVLVHFGRGAHVHRAVELLDETLAQPPASWEVNALDDVLPWDFCPSFFNYRRYFDTVTARLAGHPAGADMTAIILASLHYYRGRYAHQIPGPHAEIDHAARAVAFDPHFAEYVLYYCRLLIGRARREDLDEAAELLRSLATRSARILEIVDLSRQLPIPLQGEWHDELYAKATRYWMSTEMREHPREPWLQAAELQGMTARSQ